MNIREKIEYNEKISLNKYATLSSNTKGRVLKEKSDEIRTDFMIDRDRIIHSKSFRRLKHKTQVYIKTWGDHYRTRLTHTLEVSQIAKTIGKALGLNEELIEAIALGHDIGHVAFAHSGEELLDELLPNGFKHNENSIRVLTKIERQGKGLNLTDEVLDGILHHSGFSKENKRSYTLEGQVVRYSDKIAYVNHDIDDSIRAGLLNEEDIPKEYLSVLGKTHGERIDTLVKDCIYNTLENIKNKKIYISLSGEVEKTLRDLRAFMFTNIYKGSILREEREKAKFVLYQVFNYYLKYPEKMPEFYKSMVQMEGLYAGVADYIAGMSDDYCLLLFNKIYVPKIVIY
ncbi:dGTPase [Clostridium tetanomorphum]|uniref:Deoxyguanosinetriphosphate triphosphohydrolase-like protein n=1 Tax=Clostridium tetanomorphum TaxID=1553 RepID=A0A923E8W0_CLOTT|nr:deoxyguanosinetriphosphate triphosphohydrolase [Clostridium tetanomorphum]MBC2397387.1 deoxyguanosinetriphosphate triphosphohydrolase [Clostridium tetanomorphum]MBP1862607.1 dGTPase [Clostridium tetanomorphum]NRS85552.1 dGTPase [Clostridium tetanomorphum]NRZ96437.1 dGTPase [Clostridium tetanomorphum]SQC02726.1 deoxyguanosinetriphosphate triphosphohydrolase-like protein [Clostridium tetanomorphum]